MKHAVSNHAALNQVLTHKSFGISQDIHNHGWSGICFGEFLRKGMVFKLVKVPIVMMPLRY
ncbi:hypothetical protein T01_13549 [Trichinella spiralis]|uniref:Uncharacterized protein n=1 Tax=Trichinella spiralis TaxID=6334 RepID=A0A0V1AXY5_TRISP|nr:hypothetical protein T01_13549 [Trichinella spiralis]